MNRLLLIPVCCALWLYGCEQPAESAPRVETQVETPAEPRIEPLVVAAAVEPVPLKTLILLRDEITAPVVETPALALPRWREYSHLAPQLVLVANQPFLVPVPEPLHAESLRLAREADQAELARKTTTLTSAPVFLPNMTVRLALEADLIAGLIWVFPSRSETGLLDLEMFRSQLQSTGLITEDEANSIALRDGVFSGIIAGKPLQATTIEDLPAFSSPILVHIDAGYFQPLYKDEIKTPLYPLLDRTFRQLQAQAWATLAATVSAANLEGGASVASRFIPAHLAELLEHPDYLTEQSPASWELRSQALYLENFFQKERVRDLYLELEQLYPDDASLKFALYGMARQFKDGGLALDYLRQAVERDRVYALEYLLLADEAREKKMHTQLVRMLHLAGEALPENPFITLHLALAYIEAGHAESARPLLESLLGLTWSEVYYPDMPHYLRQLLAEIGT